MASFIVDSYSESNAALSYGVGLNAQWGVGQAFAGAVGVLDKAVWHVQRVGSPTGDAIAKIYAITDIFGTTATPTGAALATSDPVDVAALSTSLTLVAFTFTGANRITLAAGTNYFVTIEYQTANSLEVSTDVSVSTHPGNGATKTNGTGTWVAAVNDMVFYVYAGRANPARALLGVG